MIILIPIKSNLEFPGGASGKEPACQRRDLRDAGLIPGPEDPLEEGWQCTPLFLPEESMDKKEAGRLSCIGSQKVRHDTRRLSTHTHTHTEVIKELCDTAIILHFSQSSFCLLFAIQQMLSTFHIQGILPGLIPTHKNK